MRYGKSLIVIGALLGATGGASAVDLTFSGTVSNTCSLTVPTNGTLALSADGKTLGSTQTGGAAATVTIASLGTNTITVAAPVLSQSPTGYTATGQVLQVSYLGVGGLSTVNQTFTSTSTSFSTPLVPATVLTVQNQITNANGFAQGQYKTTTTVTCS